MPGELPEQAGSFPMSIQLEWHALRETHEQPIAHASRNAEILLDNADISITFERGSNDIAVVSFAGVGYRLGAIQIAEFKNTLTSSSGSTNIYYVIDKNRSWYNGIDDKIEKVIREHLISINARMVYTLGNSMGGFGAILFAKKLPNVVRSIAFSPQSSVNSVYVPFETRWQNFVGNIHSWTVPDVLPHMTKNIEYVIFFEGGHALDAQHADRFIQAGSESASVWILQGETHNAAAKLKRRGLLIEVLSVAMSGTARLPEALDEVLAKGVPFQRYACGVQREEELRDAAKAELKRDSVTQAHNTAATILIRWLPKAVTAMLGLDQKQTTTLREDSTLAVRTTAGLTWEEKRMRRESRLAALLPEERAEVEARMAERERARKAAKQADRLASQSPHVQAKVKGRLERKARTESR